jgi:hypothetical protein
MSKIILLILQKVFWSKFIKRRIKSKLLPFAVTFIVFVLSGGFVASIYFNTTFERGLWWIWSFVEDGVVMVSRSLLNMY